MEPNFATGSEEGGINFSNPGVTAVSGLPSDTTNTTLNQLAEEGATSRHYIDEMGQSNAASIAAQGQSWANAIGTLPAAYMKGSDFAQNKALKQTQQALANQQLRQATRNNDLGEQYEAQERANQSKLGALNLKGAQRAEDYQGQVDPTTGQTKYAAQQDVLAANQAANTDLQQKLAAAFPAEEEQKLSMGAMNMAMMKKQGFGVDLQNQNMQQANLNTKALTLAQGNPDDQSIMKDNPDMTPGLLAQARATAADTKSQRALNAHLSLMATDKGAAALDTQQATAASKLMDYTTEIGKLNQLKSTLDQGTTGIVKSFDDTQAVAAQKEVVDLARRMGDESYAKDLENAPLYSFKNNATRKGMYDQAIKHYSDKMSGEIQEYQKQGLLDSDSPVVNKALSAVKNNMANLKGSIVGSSPVVPSNTQDVTGKYSDPGSFFNFNPTNTQTPDRMMPTASTGGQ